MASIYKRGRVWWVDYLDATKQRKQASLNTTEETLARQLCRRMTQREDEIRSTGTSFETYAKRWIEDRKALKVRDVSNEEQRLDAHVYPVLGSLPLESLRAGDLRDWALEIRKANKLAPKTLRNVYGVIRSVIRSATVEGLVSQDPCILTAAELGKLHDKDPAWRATAVFDKREVIRLVSDPKIPAARQVVNALAALAGLREGEVCALRWSDIERREPLPALVVARSHKGSTKTMTTRQVPIHPLLASVLAAWKLSGWQEFIGRAPVPGDFICPLGKTKRGHAGRQATKSTIYKGWLKDIAATELRHRRYHDLRRTFISLALADGARRDVLERVTHQALATRAIDLYTTLPWAVLCEEVAKLDMQKSIAVAQLGSGGSHGGPTGGVLQSSYSGIQEPESLGVNSGGAGSRSRIRLVKGGEASRSLAKVSTPSKTIEGAVWQRLVDVLEAIAEDDDRAGELLVLLATLR